MSDPVGSLADALHQAVPEPPHRINAQDIFDRSKPARSRHVLAPLAASGLVLALVAVVLLTRSSRPSEPPAATGPTTATTDASGPITDPAALYAHRWKLSRAGLVSSGSNVPTGPAVPFVFGKPIPGSADRVGIQQGDCGSAVARIKQGVIVMTQGFVFLTNTSCLPHLPIATSRIVNSVFSSSGIVRWSIRGTTLTLIKDGVGTLVMTAY